MTINDAIQFLTANHVPLCEGGLGAVYATMAGLVRRHRAHALAYAVAALLALTLAAGAALGG